MVSPPQQQAGGQHANTGYAELSAPVSEHPIIGKLSLAKQTEYNSKLRLGRAVMVDMDGHTREDNLAASTDTRDDKPHRYHETSQTPDTDLLTAQTPDSRDDRGVSISTPHTSKLPAVKNTDMDSRMPTVGGSGFVVVSADPRYVAGIGPPADQQQKPKENEPTDYRSDDSKSDDSSSTQQPLNRTGIQDGNVSDKVYNINQALAQYESNVLAHETKGKRDQDVGGFSEQNDVGDDDDLIAQYQKTLGGVSIRTIN